jgi:hypothetical protein
VKDETAFLSTGLTREVLRLVIGDVRKHVPDVKLKDAWVWKSDRDHWEFHYGDYYWHGAAENAYEARSNGWSAYMRKLGIEGYE